MIFSQEDYEKNVHLIQQQMQSLHQDISKSIKSDGHEFRPKYQSKQRIDLSSFNRILSINLEEGWIDVGGMMKYDDLVRYLLQQYSSHYLPAIVPELLSITVGGAISGIGIEASSFRYGLVHDTCLDMEVLLSNGRVIHCSEKENADLFYGIPNSYGTLGYILKTKIRLIRSKAYLQIHHLTFTTVKEALGRFTEESNNLQENDYVEGIMYSPTKIHLLIGRFIDEVPRDHFLIDFNLKKPFYKSIEEGDLQSIDYMSVEHYLSRWDVDGFWGTKNSIIENPWIRYYLRNYLKTELFISLSHNSYFQYFSQLFASFSSSPSSSTSSPAVTARGDSANTLEVADKVDADDNNDAEFHYETITTDNGIPVEHWLDYVEWYYQTFPDSTPLWLCSVRSSHPCPLFQLKTNYLYCDFGTFSYHVPSKHAKKTYYNELLEEKIFEFNGLKCFYSKNCNPIYYDRIVNHEQYSLLKQKYDEFNKFPWLKEKVFL